MSAPPLLLAALLAAILCAAWSHYLGHRYALVHRPLIICQSKIAGKGVSTSAPIPADTFLFDFLIDGRVTPTGSMINHCAARPNCRVTATDTSRGTYSIYSRRPIAADEELLADYSEGPPHLTAPPDPAWAC